MGKVAPSQEQRKKRKKKARKPRPVEDTEYGDDIYALGGPRGGKIKRSERFPYVDDDLDEVSMLLSNSVYFGGLITSKVWLSLEWCKRFIRVF